MHAVSFTTTVVTASGDLVNRETNRQTDRQTDRQTNKRDQKQKSMLCRQW